MVEGQRLSHSKRERDDDDETNYHKRRGTDRDEKGNNELVVYRILCPDGFIGSVIGKSGKIINSIRQETRAKVKVVDPFPGSKDRVITIYCYVKEKEEVEVDDEFLDREPLCPAQDALLKVHEVIAKSVAMASDSDRKQKNKEECQILVPFSQAATIIGKSGSTIKKLRVKTKTNITVDEKDDSDPTHSCALKFDNFVTITGDYEAVKKALFAVSAIMYKFAPKEDIPLDTSVPDPPPTIIIPSDVPIYPATGIYPTVDSLLPPRTLSSVMGATHAQEHLGFADTSAKWPMYSSDLPIVPGYSRLSQSKELIIKLLCPSSNVGRVIGKGGSSIKSVRQTTGAQIDVNDKKFDRNECLITIIATESVGDLKSMAVETVLLLQGKINDEDEESVNIRLLVPAKVIGCLIGKGGSIINEMRKRTKADIRVSKGDKPKVADANDELVEVFGQVTNVRDALVQIVLRLRDNALKDMDDSYNLSSEVDSEYSVGRGLPLPSVLPSVPPVASLDYEQRAEGGSAFGLLSSSYRYEPTSKVENSYGSLSSYSSKIYGGLSLPSALEMVVPAHALGKVMGKGGANIENIRKISGADVEISDSRSSRGDRVALISGTPDQKRAAENLIQAFILAT